MKTKHLKLVTLALLPGFFVLLSACSTSVPGEQHTAVAKTATSTTFTDTFQATARVSAIDAATRSLTLALENGKQTTIKCGPEVKNFKQIHVNDVVMVTVNEELSIYLDKGRKMGTSESATGVLAPLGTKPGIAAVDTVRETVKITEINKTAHEVTFRGKDGQARMTKVGDHIDLSKAKVGDSVTISHTEGVAVSVQKPGN